jgi:hypothetical protein
MASHGKVLDLLDERYFKLQDVVGNVAPFPLLLPYEEYCQNILVYRMETKHDIFIGQIQDFTDRLARQSGRELWSWFVQWEVEQQPARPVQPLTPLLKKPRISAVPHMPSTVLTTLSNSKDQASQSVSTHQSPAYTTVERRRMDPEFLKEEDMLRLLLDIVQVESKLVPNFIEFLYQYIDDFEGDGYALKCAMRHEIPSLWYFEGHPTIIEEVKKAYAKASIVRRKDVVLEEESERLQYREKKFGLQPPKIDQPLPLQINIPKDPKRLQKYHAACFKNRQRAITLLLEAGITENQIKNYVKGQEAHPKDTAEEGECQGLKYYEEDKPFYQRQLTLKERLVREKYIETLISGRLDLEAEQAARNAELDATDPSAAFGPDVDAHSHLSVPAPIIPPTPSSALRPYHDAHIAVRGSGGGNTSEGASVSKNSIKSVPQSLHRRLKSKLFAQAIPEDSFDGPLDQTSGSEMHWEYTGDGTDAMDEGGDENAPPTIPNHPMTLLQHNNSPPGEIINYFRNLNYAQRQIIMQMVNQRVAQTLAMQVFTSSPSPQIPASQSVPLASPSFPTPSITVTAPSGPSSFNDVLNSFQQSNSTLQTQSTVGTLAVQNPGGTGIQQAQLDVPATVSHTTLSPSFQNLSFEVPAPSAIPNISTPSTATPITIQSFNTPQPQPSSFMEPQLSTPLPGIQRMHPPSPIKLSRPNTINKLGALGCTAPLTPHGIPVLLYYPKCLSERSILGAQENTDAVMLGYIKLWGDNSTIELTSAIFLPAQIFGGLLRRVREGNYTVLESYPGIDLWTRKMERENPAHRNAYSKLAQSFSLMTSTTAREVDVTKRWRVSPGMMTEIDRGAVWEGWGLTIDRGISMDQGERQGAIVMVHVGGTIDWETERRRKEIDELIDEEY